jgi:DNA-binding transcriptional LysR family regulator
MTASGLDSRLLEVFLAVADAESMTVAARRLGITQGAVSQQISRLEALLKLELIARENRRLRLLPAGLNLRYHARRVIEELRDCERAMRNFNRLRFHNLSIGILDTLGRTLVGPVVETLEPLAEQIQVNASVTYRHREDLLSGKLDLVITAQNFDEDEFEVHSVVNEPLVLLVTKGTIPEDENVDLEKLASTLPLIRFAHQRKIGRLTDQYLDKHRLTCHRTIEIDQTTSVIDTVKGTGGWAITSPFTLFDPNFDAIEIELRPLPPPVPRREIRLVALPGKYGDLPMRLAFNCRHRLRREVSLRLAPIFPADILPRIPD